MKKHNCRIGLLVRNIKGSKKLGVVKAINENKATVRFSKGGSDEIKEVKICDLENLNLTDKFYYDLVNNNS